MKVYLICRALGVQSTAQNSLGYPIGQAFLEQPKAEQYVAQSKPEERLFWMECQLQEPDPTPPLSMPEDSYFEQWDMMWGAGEQSMALN